MYLEIRPFEALISNGIEIIEMGSAVVKLEIQIYERLLIGKPLFTQGEIMRLTIPSKRLQAMIIQQTALLAYHLFFV
jgi:hypothetical protein